ncbi:MAG: glycoside hydrolase family 88 protein [Mediterranea massiliensis]|nr:glycoside hydrolase family 88 protein [Mediterranea massiliensis]
MNKKLLILVLLFGFGLSTTMAQELPNRRETMRTLVKVNDYFMRKWPDPGLPTYVGHKMRPSSLWTRAVYYEGLMALYTCNPQQRYFDYAKAWGDAHKWTPRGGNTTTDADNYCCSQTYIDMYRITHDWNMIQNAKVNADMIVANPDNSAWWWIDAIQMGMPVLAKLGKEFNDVKYYNKMWEMYEHTRNIEGGKGMFNPKDGLWWRDRDFDPPYKEPNGEDCYWSRGNGWVYGALVRVLQEIPEDEAHRQDYINDFVAMSEALRKCQRKDGYWNVSLHDESNFGGKEVSGTSLFVYGMAYGVRTGLLDRKVYLPVLLKAWNAMVAEAVHPDGKLGFVQGTGKEPKDGQPVNFEHTPDFEDYGLGCFLLAGTEVLKLK